MIPNGDVIFVLLYRIKYKAKKGKNDKKRKILHNYFVIYLVDLVSPEGHSSNSVTVRGYSGERVLFNQINAIWRFTFCHTILGIT